MPTRSADEGVVPAVGKDVTAGRRDPLVIKTLDFIGPMATADGWRPTNDLPEVAFAGRSNVGKSSLLNRLVRRKAFARVSNTPGRTREINFFKVNGRFVLADLPGYGYAKISKTRKAEWLPLIEGYLRASTALRGVVQLLDSRHHPSEEDLQMLDFLADVGVPTVIVLTKIDKLRKREVPERVHAIAVALRMEDDQVIPFSAETNEGRDDLAEALMSLIDQPSWRAAAEEPAESGADAAAGLVDGEPSRPTPAP
ncbi:MAG: ribosome biogenesis GTP-binding protein YihA/YsxC [Gemmatimonadaceae bacterium]|nr:ribosome biogenesis GTP-binding protein YihA/YsxC [Gemmatimonadaceae bacterium]